MRRVTAAAAVGAVAAAGAGAGSLAWLASRTVGDMLGRVNGIPGGWLKVTVNCPPERLSGADGRFPEPIARLAGRAEVSVQPAPGGRGTELGLRPLAPPPGGVPGLVARVRGSDPRQELRSALRDAKSLIEAGEVIRPDEPPSTHPTTAGKLLDLAISRAGGEGRL